MAPAPELRDSHPMICGFYTVRTWCVGLFLLALVLAPAPLTLRGQGALVELYVDSRIGPASCVTYDPASRACSNGRSTAYKTLAGVVAHTDPGTSVLIREGVYREPLVPARSGSIDRPILFRNFGDEAVTLTDIDAPALQVTLRSYIVIQGLTVTDSIGWGRLQDASHIQIQRMVFKRAAAHGTTGGLKIVRSTFNRIAENRFEEGNDNVLLQDSSNGNLIVSNVFVTARHTLIVIKCSNANVVRSNLLSNSIQKAMEIFDCEGGSDAPFVLDSTKRNVVEQNIFIVTRPASRVYQYNAIQHGGQYTIVRRNAFVHDLGGGINYQQYPSESLHVYGNRLYHNTFYDNHCFALVGNTGDARQYFDNRVVNNLFFKNHDCEGRGDQISVADTSAVILETNAIETRDPGFVDEEKFDLRLKRDSPMVDRAGPLTTTRNAGQGKDLPVRDVLWFYDGFTIPGEHGDEIQLLGTTDTARILSIDYKSDILVLDRPLSWRAGQGVSLKFAGIAPDFGADEVGLETEQPQSRRPTYVR